MIKATDRGSPKLVGTATITVIIVDLNDNSPTIPVPREIRVPESKWTNWWPLTLYLERLNYKHLKDKTFITVHVSERCVPASLFQTLLSALRSPWLLEMMWILAQCCLTLCSWMLHHRENLISIVTTAVCLWQHHWTLRRGHGTHWLFELQIQSIRVKPI